MWYESRLESDFTALGKIGNVPQFSFWQLGTPTVTCSVLLNAPYQKSNSKVTHLHKKAFATKVVHLFRTRFIE